MSRSVILVIVEGSSDRDALSDGLKALANPSHLHIQVMQGDFTSSYGTTPGNIKTALATRIKSELSLYRFSRSDVAMIIHLMDTDGAFIPATSVVQGGDRRVYKSDCMESPHVEKTVRENAHKARNMDILVHTPDIMGIPYRCYYFSRNLEHVLHGMAGDLDDDTKADLADRFAMAYGADADSFLAFFQNPDFLVSGDYAETWDYIRKGTHSLERCSNFELALNQVLSLNNG